MYDFTPAQLDDHYRKYYENAWSDSGPGSSPGSSPRSSSSSEEEEITEDDFPPPPPMSDGLKELFDSLNLKPGDLYYDWFIPSLTLNGLRPSCFKNDVSEPSLKKRRHKVGIHDMRSKTYTRRYDREVEKSDGFYVNYRPGPRVSGQINPVDLSNEENVVQCEKLAILAIRAYNKKNMRKLQLVKLVMATSQNACGPCFYLTFVAKHPRAMNPDEKCGKTYQAMVFDMDEVIAFRVKPEKGKPGPKKWLWHPHDSDDLKMAGKRGGKKKKGHKKKKGLKPVQETGEGSGQTDYNETFTSESPTTEHHHKKKKKQSTKDPLTRQSIALLVVENSKTKLGNTATPTCFATEKSAS